jgi:tetratricopeptide (TPR) repeat protein
MMVRICGALALAALLPGFPGELRAQDSALVRDRHKRAAVSSVQGGARGFGAKPKAPAAGPSGPRRALVVGISNYKNVADLQFAAADAEAFAAFLRSPAGGSVPVTNIHLLLDSGATRMRILEGVTWLQEESHGGDEAIIYFAGHGDVDKSDSARGYLLAYDARTGRDYRSEGAIRVAELREGITDIVKRGALVFLITDACRSGTVVTGQVDAPRATAELLGEWASVATMASSGPDQLSQEGKDWGGGHGVFTYFLIQGLSGLANTDNDHVVSLEEVGRFVQDSVKRATDENQIPLRFGNQGRTAAWVPDAGPPAAAAGVRSPMGVAPNADAEPTDSAVLRALAAFRAALDAGALLEPDSASAWFAYGQLQANPAAAPILWYVRGDLRQRLQADAQRVIDAYLEGGDRQPDAERIRDAATELARAAELMPKTSALTSQLGASRRFLEGYAYLQKGDYASALPPLRASVARDPQAHAYNALGFAFLASNQLDSARQAFSIARSSPPRRAYPLLGLALVTLDGGEPAPALALLDSAVAISQPQASLHLVRALALLELGRKAETIAAFRAAQKIDPRVIDEAYLRSLLSYSPGIVARVPRLRAAVR